MGAVEDYNKAFEVRYGDTRRISYSSPGKKPTKSQLRASLKTAEQGRKERQWLKENPDADMNALEQPWLDPVDTLTGGIMSLPRGLAAAATDMGIDTALGMGLEGYFGDNADKAMFIGKRGMKKLGVNPERDLVGQFSGLWDKGVRAELDDAATDLGGFINQNTGELRKLKYGSTVGDVVPGTQVLRSNPEVADVGLVSQKGGGINPNRGSYSDNKINVTHDEPFSGGETLHHELQHAIQEREGMARGGSPDAAMVSSPELASAKGVIKEWENHVKELFGTGKDPRQANPLLAKRADKAFETLDSFGDEGVANMGFDNYKLLAGEWEARNAGTRSVLPADDPRLGQQIQEGGTTFRAGQPFSTADDIALEDLIVRMGDDSPGSYQMFSKRLDDIMEGKSGGAGGSVESALPIRELESTLEKEFSGIKLDLYGGSKATPDLITLSRIVVPESERDMGVGSTIFKRITDWADANGKTIAATPSTAFGGSKSRVRELNKKFGFVDNKGRNKDFTISETMYRLPQGK